MAKTTGLPPYMGGGGKAGRTIFSGGRWNDRGDASRRAASLCLGGKDPSGRRLPAGTYRFVVEANLRWDNRVVYRGEIELDGPP